MFSRVFRVRVRVRVGSLARGCLVKGCMVKGCSGRGLCRDRDVQGGACPKLQDSEDDERDGPDVPIRGGWMSVQQLPGAWIVKPSQGLPMASSDAP